MRFSATEPSSPPLLPSVKPGLKADQVLELRALLPGAWDVNPLHVPMGLPGVRSLGSHGSGPRARLFIRSDSSAKTGTVAIAILTRQCAAFEIQNVWSKNTLLPC